MATLSIDPHAPGPTAFVFAGGGSLGAIQVGMLEALVAAGVTADLVVGASVGAINAAVFARDPTPAGVARLADMWRGIRRRDVFPLSPLRALRALAGRPGGALVSPGPLRRLLAESAGDGAIEETAIPLHVVVTRLEDGHEDVRSRGPRLDALMASAAIPGVFPPVHLDGEPHIDGGVASHTPVMAALRLGARRVVVLPTGSPCAARRPPVGGVGVALHALNLLIMRQLVRDLAHGSDRATMVVVPPLCPLEVRSYDFSHTDELMARAEGSTRAWLARAGVEPGAVPKTLAPHRHPHPG